MALPVKYKGVRIDLGYRIDPVVCGRLVPELKAVEKIQRVHEAQLPTCLKLGGFRTGRLINFNVPVLKDGLKRLSL